MWPGAASLLLHAFALLLALSAGWSAPPDDAEPAPVEVVLQPVVATAPEPAAPSHAASSAPDAPDAPLASPSPRPSDVPVDAPLARQAAAPDAPAAPAGPEATLPTPAPFRAPPAARPSRRLPDARPPAARPDHPTIVARVQEGQGASEGASAAQAQVAAETVAAPEPAPAPIAQSWRDLLAAWLAARKRYPEDARERGEQGTTFVRFTLRRDGRVEQVSIVRGSGHAALDAATAALLTGAVVPPLPPEMPQERQTVTVPLQYSLTR